MRVYRARRVNKSGEGQDRAGIIIIKKEKEKQKL